MTSKLSHVISILEDLALLSDLHGENPFKAKAYLRAIRQLGPLESEFESLYKKDELKNVEGIGKGILEIIHQVMKKEKVTALEELLSITPAGLLDLFKLPGLGPKKIQALYRDLKITSIGELEYACQENRLLRLPGFGEKTQKAIQKSIAEFKKNQGFFRLDDALREASQLVSHLEKKFDPVEIVGDLRRQTEVISQIELLVYSPSGKEVPRPKSDIPAHVHVCTDKNQWGLLKLSLTGSPHFIDAIHQQAQKNHVDLNTLHAPEEEAIFKALGLSYIAPELRESAFSLTKAAKLTPQLIQREDLQGAFHNHTLQSDGENTLEEMRDAAIARGLKYLGISDHSQSAHYASGLKSNELLEQKTRIEALNHDSKSKKCFLFSGVESDILADGSLDYPDDVLKQLDFVVASVHSRLKQNETEMTTRMVNAAKNPLTSMIGHPTGRLLLSRAPSQFDFEALLDACEKSGCALELNAHPHRLDLNEVHLAMAKERKIKIVINADAHITHGLDDLQFGVMIARRAGLTPEDVLNCLPLPEILKWLKKRK